MRLLAAIILLLSSISSGASLKPSDQNMAILLSTVDYVFADNFTQAHKVAAELDDSAPGEPLYHLLYASILHARMMDGEDFSYEKDFMRNIDISIKALDKWIDQNPDDAWGHFFLGSALGYKAVWQGQEGSWLKSLLNGLKAKGKFSDALRLDAGLYDCYTGLGSFHYWSSVKLRKLFPFLSDNRQEGLAELKLAMDSSYISSKAAAVGYGWALLNEKRYSGALKIAQHLNETTGGGRNALWLLGGIYWSNGNLRKAAENYARLIESLERAEDQNYYNLIFCRYRRGVCLFGLQKYNEAEQEFKTLQSYMTSDKIKERHKKTLLKTKEYLVKIEEANSGKT